MIESEIDAGLASDQMARLLTEIWPHKGARGLVVTPREAMEFSIVGRTCAALRHIGLISLRWAELAELARPARGDAGSLATYFKELSMSEGLGHRAAAGRRRLECAEGDAGCAEPATLVAVAAGRVAQAPPRSRKGQVVRAARMRDRRRVSAGMRRGDHRIQIALAASDGLKNASGSPVLAIAVTDERLTDTMEQRAWAEKQVARVPGTERRWVRRPIPASELAAPETCRPKPRWWRRGHFPSWWRHRCSENVTKCHREM